jgi:hypothetical protein
VTTRIGDAAVFGLTSVLSTSRVGSLVQTDIVTLQDLLRIKLDPAKLAAP